MILSRFVISDITTTSCGFEQAFSDDWGSTWEPNWITGLGGRPFRILPADGR